MDAAWTAVAIAGLALGAPMGGYVWRAGRREGRLDAILERLTDVTEDHEDRIRSLERR